MAKLSLKYGAILIGLYIAAVHATNLGNAVKQGAAGAVDITKGLQGR